MPVGTRRFDLYDFFSVFIPGATILIGLFPFLPEETDVGSLVTLLPLLLGGYVVGRGLHSAAAKIDEIGDTHRTRFYAQFEDEPSDITTDARDRFLVEWEEVYQFTDGKTEAPNKTRDDQAMLYTASRSLVHIDGRGRSRTFQAIYAFHRSMWFAVMALGLLYLTYAVLRLTGRASGLVGYRSFIGALDVEPTVLVPVILLGFSLSFATFRRSKRVYRRHFAEYLIADFLTLRTAFDNRDGGSSAAGTQGKSGTRSSGSPSPSGPNKGDSAAQNESGQGANAPVEDGRDEVPD